MKKTTRLTTLLLLAAMFVSTAAACSDSGSTDDVQSTSEVSTTEAAETEAKFDEYGREIINHELPDDLDYGGMDIGFVVRDNPKFTIDVGVESLNGEIVNDTVYERNRKVEEELNVKFTTKLAEDTNTSVQYYITTAVMAGDTSYDVGQFYQFYSGEIILSGMMYNIYDIDTIDYEKPWWNDEFFTELDYNGKIFLTTGSMNLSVTSLMMGIYFNQTKMKDYYDGYEFLYDEVYDGTWTFSRMAELTKDVYNDLNGNSEADAEDFYGMTTVEDNHGSWMSYFDIRTVTIDEAGVPQLTLFTDKTVSAYDMVFNYYRKSQGVNFNKKNYDYVTDFANGKSLMSNCTFYDSETKLRSMEDPYGILPMPKYDEAQEEYKNVSHDNSNIMGVVMNAEDPNAVGAVLELMNYYSYKDLIPAYFEVAVKQKYLSDSDSAKMFDIIIEGEMADFGRLYSLVLSGGKYVMGTIYYGTFRNNIRLNNPDIASAYAANEELYKTSLESLIEKLDALE